MNNSNQPDPQQQPASTPLTGSLQKEQESLPSAAIRFSELQAPIEGAQEKESSNREHTQVVPAAGNQAQAIPVQQIHQASVAQQNQSSQTAHPQHVLTKQQAQQMVKGPLIFKNSSDPLIWLSFLLLKHYQLLEKEGKK